MAISSAVRILEWRVVRHAEEKPDEGTQKAEEAWPLSEREPSVKMLIVSGSEDQNCSAKRATARYGLANASFLDKGNLMKTAGKGSQGGEGETGGEEEGSEEREKRGMLMA